MLNRVSTNLATQARDTLNSQDKIKLTVKQSHLVDKKMQSVKAAHGKTSEP